MMAGVVEETLQQKLKRHEDALVACMAEITKLREENARLRSESDGAHDVLRRIYLDEAAPSGVRVKAAQAALNVEKPRLAPVEAPLELVAEPVEDLATKVARQRARMAQMLQLTLEQRAALITGVGGNGSDGDDDSDDTAG